MQYFYFLLAIAGSIVVGKAISWIFANTLTRLAKNTKTNLDDFLIEALRNPITVAITIIGIYFSFNLLNMDSGLIDLRDKAFFVVSIIFAGWLGTKIVGAFLQNIVKPVISKTNSKLDDHLLPVLSKALKTIVWILVAITILSNLGYDVTAILAGLGIGGLAFAFAAQKTIADIFGGMSLLFSKPFIVGDVIEIRSMNLTGTVVEIGLRNTRLKDADNRINTIPNSDLSAAVVKNISSEPTRKITTDLGLTYSTTSKQLIKAKEIVKKIIESEKECNKNPDLLVNEFKNSSINLRVVYYANKNNWEKVQDAVNIKIKEQFDKNKIEFAYPTQTVYLKK
jgi:MscS family membrane protein